MRDACYFRRNQAFLKQTRLWPILKNIQEDGNPGDQAIPAEAVIASPAPFAGRGNPGFSLDGSPRLNASQPRDDGFSSLAGIADAHFILKF